MDLQLDLHIQLFFLLLCAPSCGPSSQKHNATTFWNVWIKNKCISRTTQCMKMRLVPLCWWGPAHSNDTNVLGLKYSLGCPQRKTTKFTVLSLREWPTQHFSDTLRYPRQLLWGFCKTLAKRCFTEGTGNDIQKYMIRSWFSNVSDCYVKLLLAQVGIDARAPFFSCQIQWTQPSFLWYNQLTVRLIFPCMSVRLSVVSEYRSLTLYIPTLTIVDTHMHM